MLPHEPIDVLKAAREAAFKSEEPMVDAGIRYVLTDLHEFMVNQDLWSEANYPSNGRAGTYDRISALMKELG